MDRRGDDRRPYWRAQALVAWARFHAWWLDGISRTQRIEWPDTIPEWLNVVRVALVDYHRSAFSTVPEVLTWFDEINRWGTPMRPDEKSWGMTPEQERAALAKPESSRAPA